MHRKSSSYLYIDSKYIILQSVNDKWMDICIHGHKINKGVFCRRVCIMRRVLIYILYVLPKVIVISHDYKHLKSVHLSFIFMYSVQKLWQSSDVR